MTAIAPVKSLLKHVPPIVRLRRWLDTVVDRRRFRAEFEAFSGLVKKLGRPRFELSWADRYPCLADRTATTGFDRHYVYHCAWAARAVAQIQPKVHVDISSYVYFCSLVSAFVPVKFYDYRPADLKLSNLTSGAVDLCGLPFEDRSVESLSCMHVVEHVGLGRYGDPLDPEGDLKAIGELKRVLAVGGLLLFVVPVGKPRIMFNAHRVYSYQQVLDYFSGLSLEQFAVVPDHPRDGGLVVNPADPSAVTDAQRYGCGCFWFRRAR